MFSAPSTSRKPVHERVWFWVAIAVVVIAAIAASQSGNGDPGSAGAASMPATTQIAPPAPRVLPDGKAATAAQDAYLDAVEPHLSPARASDTIEVLSSGEAGVCGLWLHPSDPGIQVQAVNLLMDASGYNETEATVIARAASEHLCPGK